MKDSVHDKMFALAKIYSMSNLPEDSLRYMQDIAKLKKTELTIEEINLLFHSIDSLVQQSKKSFLIINSIEAKEIKKKSKFVNAATDAKNLVYKDVYDNIISGFSILDRHLLRTSNDEKNKAIYLMHKANLNKHLIDLADKENEKEISELKNKIKKIYIQAYDLCKLIDDLSVEKAGVILNYVMFLYEEMGEINEAYKIGNEFFQCSSAFLGKLKREGEAFFELKKILYILKENLDIWIKKINGQVTSETINSNSLPKKENE